MLGDEHTQPQASHDQNEPRVVFTPEQTKSWIDSVEKRMSSAAVWCVTPDGRLLVNKSNYKRHWSIPGGIIDADETPKAAAIRECAEEMGIALDPDDVTFCAIIDRVSHTLGHTYQFVFCADITNEQVDNIVLQASEIDEYALVTRDEIMAEDRDSGRWFGKVIFHWAEDRTGYIEQTFSYAD